MNNFMVHLMLISLIILSYDCQANIIRIPEDQPTIQDGVDAATSGDTILVSTGFFSGLGNTAVLINKDGVTIQSVNGPESCIIDCEFSERAFYVPFGATNSTRIKGFTIKNGSADGSYPFNCGGAILIEYSAPIIENCIFDNNYAEGGGALYIDSYGTPTQVINCKFTNNVAYTSGGAVYIPMGSEPIFIGCIFDYNSSWDKGGALSTSNSWPNIDNCLFSNNSADRGGGLYLGANSWPILTNCTISSNAAGIDGGGIYINSSYSPICLNSVIWGNESDQIFLDNADFDITYSNIQGGFSGLGNIDLDPMFISGTKGNYYLSSIEAGQSQNSPCINNGSDLSNLVCFQSYYGFLCMNELTTRTDEVVDNYKVDMGFHYYPINYSTPTPTATPTNTPTLTPTQTPIPTDTPIPSPTVTYHSRRYSWDLNSNPNWVYDGEWQWGQPSGNYGDPSAGFTGLNVTGYNLNGSYGFNLSELFMTTGSIDCSNLTDVEVRFQRWLGVESSLYDHACFQASNNGLDWVTIWNHDGGDLIDTDWVSCSYDISAIADEEDSVFLRWCMGPTDSSIVYCGWNLDDVEIWADLSGACVHHGDVNNDGNLTSSDAQSAFLIALGIIVPSYDQECAADCNGNEDVTAGDAQTIFLAVLGMGACIDPLNL